jgi:hypothetical protein
LKIQKLTTHSAQALPYQWPYQKDQDWLIVNNFFYQKFSKNEILRFYITLNAGMPDCLASCQSGTGLQIINDAKNGPVPDKMMQSGIFIIRYRTGMTDAGMPMPALVFRMPMPTYGS